MGSKVEFSKSRKLLCIVSICLDTVEHAHMNMLWTSDLTRIIEALKKTWP
jgi:hypothetical protein